MEQNSVFLIICAAAVLLAAVAVILLNYSERKKLKRNTERRQHVMKERTKLEDQLGELGILPGEILPPPQSGGFATTLAPSAPDGSPIPPDGATSRPSVLVKPPKISQLSKEAPVKPPVMKKMEHDVVTVVLDYDRTPTVTREKSEPPPPERNLPYQVGQALHIGNRKEQQDALDIAELETDGGAPRLLAVLCDGMGGMENGAQASALAVRTMVEDFQAVGDGDIVGFLRQEAHRIDRRIVDELDNGERSCGTTMVAAAVSDSGALHWLSVGDSRIYILRGQEIVQVTRDHNYFLLLTEQVRSGEITAAEAEQNKDREALVSYLGIGGLSLMDINPQPFQLEKNDLVLLCSDGLTKTLSQAQILSFIQDGPVNLSLCARMLTHKAYELRRGSQDNTSVILIRYSGI